MNQSFFEIQDVTFSASKKNKVFNVTFDIEKEGEIVCLLGPSGIGKTTILRAIAGLEKIQSGKITLKGKYFSGKLQVGYEKEMVKRKIVEEWTDSEGRTWVQKDGYYMNKTKLDAAKVPLFCPKCNGNMGDHESKFHTGCWSRFGHCYSCQLKFETKLKVEGKWEDFVKALPPHTSMQMVKAHTAWINSIEVFPDILKIKTCIAYKKFVYNYINNITNITNT